MSGPPRAVVLRIRVNGPANVDWIAEALGECARELEAHEASGQQPVLDLVPDSDDPGRYAWEIVLEAYS